MSQGNAEITRAGYAAWAKGDLNAWLETLHPEVEFQTTGRFPDLAPIYRGHREMRLLWEAMIAPWESFRLDVERIVEGGECAAVAVRFRAQGKGSGVLTDLRQGHALRFKGGRTVKVSAHSSFEEALEAAGLSK
jgi:ketosteroid isomerase-like protein